MSEGVTNSWVFIQSTFYKVVEKIRKRRRKVYSLSNMKGIIIFRENIPKTNMEEKG